MTYRVIALDLDGTLLNRDKKILPESLQALEKARQQGLDIVIVTGRHHIAVRPFYAELALNTPILCCNGTYIYHPKTQRFSDANPLKQSQSLSVLEIQREFNLPGLLYVDDAILYQEHCEYVDRMRQWAATLPAEHRPNLLQVDSLQEALQSSNSIWKFAIANDNLPVLRQFCQRVEAELQLACEWSWSNQVDIAQQGNHKGKLLSKWVTSQGLNMDQVIAFGDNFNDISMLQLSGCGVAMGNSDPAVQATADVVIEDHDLPGIAAFLHDKVIN